MKTNANKTVQSIFQLHSNIELMFFKEFMHHYDLPEGLNQTHMRAMLMLAFHKDCTMSNISQMLSIEKGSFTPVANKLLTLAYITRQRSDTDRRIHHLTLTPKGESITKDFTRQHMTFIESMLNGLNDNKKGQFIANIDMINQTLNELSSKELPIFASLSS